MSKFITNPNLPQSKVETIICGSKNKILTNYTKYFNIEIIESDLNNTVDSRVADHTDISVHHLGKNKILLDYTQKSLEQILISLGMNVTVCGNQNDKLRVYPEDCSLNCARINDALFGKKISIEQNLLNYAMQNQINLINVNQGYTKCSMLIVNENSFITDDESIYAKGLQNGFNCLIVSKGNVKLSGFDYGFIGGCGGLIDKNHLIFFGDITAHNDYHEINKFLQNANCKFDYLKDYPLTDIGGFVPILEKT